MSVTIREPIFGPNGTAKQFTTSRPYNTGTLQVHLNGQKLLSGLDYTELGGVLFEHVQPPFASDLLFATYEVDFIQGFVRQETSWKTGDIFYFKHIADVGLTVNIRIVDTATAVNIVGLTPMIEVQPGVYQYAYAPVSVGIIHAIMQDITNLTQGVHELKVLDIDLSDIMQKLSDIQDGSIGMPGVKIS